jgi:hypothetical protein
MSEQQCAARTNGEHCYHVLDDPHRLPNGGAGMFVPTICCWCAPSYLRLNVFLDPRVDDEDLTVQQMTHGPRIVVQRLPRRQGPSLVVPNGH